MYSVAAELDEPAADVAVAAAHGVDDSADGNAVGQQAVRVDIDLELLAEAADGRHLGDAGDCLQVVAQVPVLQRAHFGQRVLAGIVDQDVLEDPAEPGGVGAELGLHALGQPRQDSGEVFERARARPVDVGAVLEDDVDEGIAEVGEAAHGAHSWGAEQGGDDRVGDLVFEDVGAAVPARVDDDLGVAQVGDGVERHGAASTTSRRRPQRRGAMKMTRAGCLAENSMMRLIMSGVSGIAGSRIEDFEFRI